ncbi:MAG TPA: molecular chaperone [Ruminococcaceae bacterium]|nr:molecular chaperone [Oscillospiraceae bacterium]
MAIEIFNRYENKYKISEDVFFKLHDQLSDVMQTDDYNKKQFTYPICNVYYDSADSYLIRHSISKPLYKEKLRLRSYGTPGEGSTVYVEIKKKFRGLTNKRRSGLKLNEAYAFLSSGDLPIHRPYMNAQVLREIQYLLCGRELRPAVYLSYERRAFFGDASEDLRISFDTNILSRREDLRLESGIYGENLLPGGVWLMEIKTARAIPIWLTKLLSEYRIYPQSFSKYGAEYKALITSAPDAGKIPDTVIPFPVPAYAQTVPVLVRA